MSVCWMACECVGCGGRTATSGREDCVKLCFVQGEMCLSGGVDVDQSDRDVVTVGWAETDTNPRQQQIV